MKKYFLSIAMLLATSGAFAQAQVTVSEPEFVNSYCILTSESTYDILPKENGEIQKHQNKVSKWAKIAGAASRMAGAAGVLGAATAGSMSGVMTGAKVVGAASSVSSAASAENELREAKEKIRSLLYPVLSYTETKAMGCTDIVYWDGEPQANPETGNEFFTPEDAKALYTKLKEVHADEIEDEDDEAWIASNHIWKDAASLEDLVLVEKEGLW